MSTLADRTANYPLTLYFDGACPLCKLEIDNLQALNAQQLLRFVDIAAAGFDPAPLGVTLSALNGLIHATRPNGSLVIGVEVFRLAYAAVGLGRWTAPTGWPVLKPVVDAAYRVFARNRQTISRVFFKSAAPCNSTVCKPPSGSDLSSRSTS